MMILDVVLMVVAVAIILLSLLQGGNGISGAFTGSGGLNLFANVKERGPEKTIANITLVLGIAFFVLVVLIQVL